ncbi:MAG: RNA polymerase sigma factor RpoH [Rhodospirillales bacterium]|nr:MAG: RNA polymerase sigma factor RpoH [Rhodospirillales bacterium]
MSNRRWTFQSPPDESVGSYIRRVQKFPLLTAEQELMLAKRFAANGDKDAAHALVSSHLRLVAKIAMGYRGYGLPVDELISQGNLGLMQAVDRFDPERGYRLATYAMWWIRAAIQEYIVHSWSLVKMGTTSEQKKLFFNLRRIKRQIQAVEEGDLHPENVTEIATRLKVPEAEVVSMNRRLAGSDASLNAPLRDESESEWQDWLMDETEDQEARLAATQERDEQRRMLGSAMGALSARERDIVSERHLNESPMTLEALSRRYGISRERVRQIEVGALAKLKKAVHKESRRGAFPATRGPDGRDVPSGRFCAA